MIKKIAALFFGLLLFSSLGFAMPESKDGFSEELAAKRKAKFESMKKEQAQYQSELDALVEKYNKAPDAQKEEVKKEITECVSKQTDQEIISKKEFLSMQKSRIEKLENKISEMESDKAGYINKKVDFIVSREGQAKTKEKIIKNEK